MRRLLIALLVALPAVIATPAHATYAVETDGDSYLVTGGVIQHEIYSHDREEAARCVNCFWKITVICQNWEDAAHGNCPYWRLKCPSTMRLAEVYRVNAPARPPTNSPLWSWQGFTCLNELPASTQLIEHEIRESWRVLVPPLRVTTKPAHNTLVDLLTDVQEQSSNVLTATAQMLGGNEVTLRAVARHSFLCSSSCGYWSNSIKFHTAGIHNLTVTEIWNGYFSANGISDLAISDPPIVHKTSLTLNVYEVKRHLIPNPKGNL